MVTIEGICWAILFQLLFCIGTQSNVVNKTRDVNNDTDIRDFNHTDQSVVHDLHDGMPEITLDQDGHPIIHVNKSQLSLSQFREQGKQNVRVKRSLFKYPLWPNGVVPYVFDKTVSAADKAVIILGLNMIMERVPCIKYRPATEADIKRALNYPYNYLIFENKGSGCFGGGFRRPASVILSPGCVFINHLGVPSVVIHELMHDLGVAHEQIRPDRDDYVELNFTQLGNWEREYIKMDSPVEDVTEGEYDYRSLMHYSRYIGVGYSPKNGEWSMRVKPPHDTQKGLLEVNDAMSEKDYNGLRNRYGCPGELKNDAEYLRRYAVAWSRKVDWLDAQKALKPLNKKAGEYYSARNKLYALLGTQTRFSKAYYETKSLYDKLGEEWRATGNDELITQLQRRLPRSRYYWDKKEKISLDFTNTMAKEGKQEIEQHEVEPHEQQSEKEPHGQEKELEQEQKLEEPHEKTQKPEEVSKSNQNKLTVNQGDSLDTSNCAVTHWSKWSSCKKGRKGRIRRISQEPDRKSCLNPGIEVFATDCISNTPSKSSVVVHKPSEARPTPWKPAKEASRNGGNHDKSVYFGKPGRMPMPDHFDGLKNGMCKDTVGCEYVWGITKDSCFASNGNIGTFGDGQPVYLMCRKSCNCCPGEPCEASKTEKNQATLKEYEVCGKKTEFGPTLEDFKKYVLLAHNDFRDLHENTPPMKWDDTLQREAQNRCDELVKNDRIDGLYFNFRKTDALGGSGQLMSARYCGGRGTKAWICDKIGAGVAKSWYSAIRYYNWNNADRILGMEPEDLEGTEYFSQIVWAATTKLGCAGCFDRETNGEGVYDDTLWTYIVCNYYPLLGSDANGNTHKLNWGVHPLKDKN